MTAGDKRLFEKLCGRIHSLEQKLESPDWEHVNNPVAYCQGAYKRVSALENEVAGRVRSGVNIRERLKRVERRVDAAHERRGRDRIVYRVGQLEQTDRHRNIKRRALFERRIRSRAALCDIGTSVGYILIIGFACYGVVTLVSKFV